MTRLSRFFSIEFSYGFFRPLEQDEDGEHEDSDDDHDADDVEESQEHDDGFDPLPETRSLAHLIRIPEVL